MLDRSQLIPTARETYDGVLVVLEQVLKDTVSQQQHAGAASAHNGTVM